MNNINEAMIFAAGFGKRMLPLTKKIPKPLVKIKNKPLISYIIEDLIDLNFKNIVVNVHHLYNQIIEELKKFEPTVTFVYEKEILETGGGLVHAINKNKFYEPFRPKLLINGDVFWTKLSKSPVKEICEYWDSNMMDILVGLRSKKNLIGYKGNGDFSVKKIDNNIAKILENTGDKEFVFTGIQIVKTEILDLERKKFSMREVLFSARKNKTLYGLKSKQNIFHIGNVSDLKMINELDF